MGHVRLGVLPRSRKWRQVVEDLRLGASAERVAGLAATAAEKSLQKASNDPAFLHSFWLLTQLPLAARGPAFVEDLASLGLSVPDRPGFMSVLAALSDAVDDRVRTEGGRTDLGEMAQMAAVESLTATVAPTLSSLFRPEPEDVQRAIGRVASGDRFAALARDFFARITQRILGYFLSRELSKHIGDGGRFVDDHARSQFDRALQQVCKEASSIIEQFAGDWYGKAIYHGQGLTTEAIRRFAPVALKKIRDELRKRRDAIE